MSMSDVVVSRESGGWRRKVARGRSAGGHKLIWLLELEMQKPQLSDNLISLYLRRPRVNEWRTAECEHSAVKNILNRLMSIIMIAHELSSSGTIKFTELMSCIHQDPADDLSS